MVNVSKRDLAIIAGLAGVADILTEHRFSIPVERAIKRAFRQAAPVAARSVGRVGVTALQVGKQVALRHPVLTAGAVVYYTYKNREELGDLVEKGYEIIQPVVQPASQFLREEVFTPKNIETLRDRGIIGVRRPSAFNKAVKKGMAVVKASTSYGKKGTINNAKKAFSAVTKVASAASKKKKAPKKGITRKIYMAIKGLFK